MAKIKKAGKAIIVLLAIWGMISIYITYNQDIALEKSREKVKEYWSLYKESKGNESILAEIQEKHIKEIAKLKNDHTELVNFYKPQIAELKKRLDQYEGVEFKSLEDCQKGYDGLLILHGESTNLYEGMIGSLTDNFEKRISAFKSVVELSESKYQICLIGQNLLNLIITEKDTQIDILSRKKWGWFLVFGPYLGIGPDGVNCGVCLTYGFGRKI